MHRKTSSGQALVEYGLILVLVALASVVVLAVLGPSIGINFHNAADASNNPEVRAIQQRQTDIVRGTVFFETGSTLTNSPVPPGSTRTNTPVPPGSTNTPVPPGPTNTPVPPTAVVPTAVPTNTPTSTPTNTFTPVPTAVPEWTYCADENGTCNFSGTKEVRYGENGFFFYAIFTNTTACSNGVFGDPVSGTAKHCYYRSVNSIQSVTAIRRAGDRNKLDISIKLARTGSNVTITDSQSGQVLSNQACATSGAVTCTYTITLTDAQIAAGMITVSGTDFNGQTFSVGYPAK